LQKFLFVVEILTKHGRGLLFCRTLYMWVGTGMLVWLKYCVFLYTV